MQQRLPHWVATIEKGFRDVSLHDSRIVGFDLLNLCRETHKILFPTVSAKTVGYRVTSTAASASCGQEVGCPCIGDGQNRKFFGLIVTS
jgi:hypothetical protein